jgi:hypothetical protein
MTICLVKVPPALAERIQADPELLNQIWPAADEEEDEPAALDAEIASIDEEDDTVFEDYLGLGRDVQKEPGRYPWMERALHGGGTEIDYDFGWGNGFTVTAEEAAEIADGLAAEGWWSPGQEVTLIAHAVAAFYRTAADQGRTVIGGIS